MTTIELPDLTAERLVAEARKRGIGVHRFRGPPKVIAVTGREEDAGWLRQLGATRGMDTDPDGSYLADRVTTRRAFDFDLHMATVREHFVRNDEGDWERDAYVGALAIWEAAA